MLGFAPHPNLPCPWMLGFTSSAPTYDQTLIWNQINHSLPAPALANAVLIHRISVGDVFGRWMRYYAGKIWVKRTGS